MILSPWLLSVDFPVHEVRSVPDGIDLDFEIDTRGEDVFAQYVNPDQCRLVAFDGYFVPQGDGACRSFAEVSCIENPVVPVLSGLGIR